MAEADQSGSEITRDAPPSGLASPAAFKPSLYAWYTLGLLVLVYAISFIDRQILSVLAQDVKADLALTDAELGFLYGTAFAIFYTVFGIPLGRLADGWRRGWLMAIGLLLWSAMTVASGFATSFSMLAVARIGVGIGEASVSPAAYSMLAGLFPQSRRALAIGIYTAGAYLGIGLSLPIGGLVSDTWNQWYAAGTAPLGLRGWQAAFIAVGLPGILVAAWVASLREPMRHDPAGRVLPVSRPGVWRDFGVDVASLLPPFTLWSVARFPGELRRNLFAGMLIAGVVAAMTWLTGDGGQWIAYGLGVYAILSWSQALRHSDPPAFALIWGSSLVPLALVGFGGAVLITYAFGFWATPFAMRSFGVSASHAGLVIGIPGAIASAAGVVAGGRLSDWWKKRDARGRIFTGMVSLALPVPLILLMFTRDSFYAYALISPAIYFLSSLYTASGAAAYQDLVLPRMYGTIGAIFLAGSTMVGLAIGPYVTGKVATLTGSLETGVLSMLLMPPIALFALWRMSRKVEWAETTKVARARAAGEKQG